MSKRCDGVIVISPLNVWYVFQTHARFEFITAMAWENSDENHGYNDKQLVCKRLYHV